MRWRLGFVAFICATLWCLAAFPQSNIIGSGIYGDVKVSGGGATTTFDPSNTGSGITLSGGNLTATATPGTNIDITTRSVANHTTGKFYFEGAVGAYTHDTANEIGIGVVNASAVLRGSANYIGVDTTGIGDYIDTGAVYYNGSQIGTASAFNTIGNIPSVAVDIGAGLFWARTGSGNWNNSGTANPATGTGGISFTITGALYAAVVLRQSNSSLSMTANFGGTSYANTPPSGFGNW